MHTMSRLSETLLSVWLPIPRLHFVCLGLLRLCLSEALLWQVRTISILNSQFSILNFLHLTIPMMQNTS